jgi:hypothetical protein
VSGYPFAVPRGPGSYIFLDARTYRTPNIMSEMGADQ